MILEQYLYLLHNLPLSKTFQLQFGHMQTSNNDIHPRHSIKFIDQLVKRRVADLHIYLSPPQNSLFHRHEINRVTKMNNQK